MPIWTAVGAVMVVLAAIAYRVRMQALSERELITDDLIRQIERDGSIHVDAIEPLDHQHIRMEEDRFWEEAAWDEPDEL